MSPVSESLIATKFMVPILRRNVIPRHNLRNQLERDLWKGDGFVRKLTLVSAPAGYGKTTLIADWGSKCQHLEDPENRVPEYEFCWLSLDERDNDQVRFLVYFIAALKQADEKIGTSTQAMLQSPQPPPPELLLGSLINDITTVSNPIVLILDDYHQINNPNIHQMLNFIMEYQPSQIHLVLLTREDPPLPLPRLRARGQIMEVRQDDLRFTKAETAEYLQKVIGLDLSAEDISSLDRRTEGWVAGLQLAALSMQGRDNLSDYIQDFAGSNRYILDYLIEEVFQNQPPEVQEFLLTTSILDQLSAPLCDAVTKRDNSRELLQSLDHSNLFIVALDQEYAWYRFHRLFVELLRHRLRISTELTEAKYHGRASLWFEANGYSAEAIQHALSAEDWERAAELIQDYTGELLKRGEVMTLIGWIKRLPEQMIQAYPELCGDYAWALLLIGEFDEAEPLLAYAEKCDLDNPQFQGGIASAQAYLARCRGDFQGTIQQSEMALSLLPSSDLMTRSIVAVNLGLTYWHAGYLDEAEKALREALDAGRGSGNQYAAVAGRVFLGRTAASRGNLRRAEELYRQLLRDGGPIPMLALTHLDLCGLNYEWNKLKVSEEHRWRGVELCKQSGNLEFQIAGELLHARLKIATGAIEAAERAAVRAYEMAQDFSPFTRARCASSLVQVALAKDDLKTAEEWASRMAVDGDHFTFYMFLNLTRARLLMAKGKQEEAAAELSRCYEIASKGGWGYGIIAVRVLQCLATENAESSYEFLFDALTQAHSNGFLRAFVDGGQDLIPTLQEVARKGKLVEYVGEILTTMGETTRVSQTSELVEPLSEREIEVLRLLVAGLSNREIAGKLVISLGTAKTHIHNIYGKLSARNRAEAIARTRELELL
jgi:LuxR family maltose regulon positive regulatory protein